jgi:hypothetical protein
MAMKLQDFVSNAAAAQWVIKTHVCSEEDMFAERK